MSDSLGVYISIPFCRAKCSYCNFASGVFRPERMERYVERLTSEIACTRALATRLQASLPDRVDTIYLGGGTPSLLSAEQVQRLFTTLRNQFVVAPDAEITVECAPGQLPDQTLEELQRQGMNRVSLGVQSFIDAESRAVGRLHTRVSCLDEIARLRAAGLDEINLDLIAGLPRQTRASLLESIDVALATNVPHLSLYMLEVDEDSRLGRELLDHGRRYGADAVPTEDDTADWTTEACERLASGGVAQYEISNFARSQSNSAGAGKREPDHRSRHNVKYWHRDPYLGFGLDAHSMLRRAGDFAEALRWANPDELDAYLEQQSLAGVPKPDTAPKAELAAKTEFAPKAEVVTRERAFEETIFLGLRMNEGLDLSRLREQFGEALLDAAPTSLAEVEEAGLLARDGSRIRLTPRGRMASNEVFSRLLVS